jgi:CheY-specific phosphatase CheX
MNSQYFAQYLLNTGMLSGDEVKGMLMKSMSCKPKLPLLAMYQGLVTARQLTDLGVETAAFAAAAQEKGLLTKSQVQNLSQAVTGESLRFAQALLDAGRMDYVRLAELFADYREAPVRPLKEAVARLADGSLDKELEYYNAYVEIFMRSLIRFMDTPAVINVFESLLDSDEQTRIVSQRLSGDLSMVTGLFAADDTFVEMARRYSREDIQEVDELAVDSITEFLNVMNGLYAIDLAKRQMDVDLELPRAAKNQKPVGSHQLELRIDTGFGSFVLVLATDEFVLHDLA